MPPASSKKGPFQSPGWPDGATVYRERVLAHSAGYEVMASVWDPSLGRIIFVTSPIREIRRRNSPHSVEKSIIVGFMNVDTSALGSFITEPFSISNVTRLATWRDGIVMCSPVKIVYLSMTTGSFRTLISADQLELRSILDITVDREGYLWLTEGFEMASRIALFCSTNGPGLPLRRMSAGNIPDPSIIARSPTSNSLYYYSNLHGCIYCAKIGYGQTLNSFQRLTYICLKEVSALKVDANDNLYIASENVLFRFDRNGNFKDRTTCQKRIQGIDFAEDRIILSYNNQWTSLEGHSSTSVSKAQWLHSL